MQQEAVADGSAVRSELRSIEAQGKENSGEKEKDSFFEEEDKEKIYLVASSQSSEGAVV